MNCWRLAAAVAAALVLVTGCGNDAGSDRGNDLGDTTGATADESVAATSETPAAAVAPADPPLPPCDQVWVEGEVLSEEFLGCREAGETVVKSLRCETGQELFTHAGKFFAVPGTRIHTASGALADDKRFQRIYRACTA